MFCFFFLDYDNTISGSGRKSRLVPKLSQSKMSPSSNPLLAVSSIKHVFSKKRVVVVPTATVSTSSVVDSVTGSHDDSIPVTLTSDQTTMATALSENLTRGPVTLTVDQSMESNTPSKKDENSVTLTFDPERNPDNVSMSTMTLTPKDITSLRKRSEVKGQRIHPYADKSSSGDRDQTDMVSTVDSSLHLSRSRKFGKSLSSKKSAKSFRSKTAKSGLSSDIYRITSSESLPVSPVTLTKTHLASSLTDLTFIDSYDGQFSLTNTDTQMDRHSDSDLIRIRVDHAESSESDLDLPITFPMFPNFLGAKPHFFVNIPTNTYSRYSATSKRPTSYRSLGTYCKFIE
jgi:hypothetical protein